MATVTIESELALSKMSLGMTAEPTGDVDRDFVAMMMPITKGPSISRAPSSNTGKTKSFGGWLATSLSSREREMLVMRGAVGKATSAERADTSETTLEHATSRRSGKE